MLEQQISIHFKHPLMFKANTVSVVFIGPKMELWPYYGHLSIFIFIRIFFTNLSSCRYCEVNNPEILEQKHYSLRWFS